MKNRRVMKDKNLTVPIAIISVLVPVVVACLMFMPHSRLQLGFNIKILPLIEALLNACTFIFLLASLYFIKNKNIKAHKTCNLIAVGLSVLFFICYLTFHFASNQVHYDGTGWIRPVYFVILITHIVLSAVIVPLVLVTLIRALKGKFILHKKIARITWPIWVYVTLSGVIVYIMMAPYY